VFPLKKNSPQGEEHPFAKSSGMRRINLLFAGFIIVWAFVPSHSKALPELARLPYLQSMTATSVLIAWRTSQSQIGEIEYKLHRWQKIFKVIEKKEGKIHAITLYHLQPNTTYWYRVLNGKSGTPLTGWIWFKTFPLSPNASFTFGVLGDSGNGSSYQKEVAHQLFLHHPDLVIHTGDVIYDGSSDADFDKKFFSIYGKLAETTPFFPSIGNNDWAWDHAKPYLENFYLPQNSPGKGRYYSFNCGGVHFVALNSNEPLEKGSTQYNWLLQDLKKNKRRGIVVYFHHPIYSSGHHGSTLWLRRSLEPLFVHFHVALVFNGHDHDYERTIPIHGVTYIVTGGGGGILYPVGSSAFTAFSATVHHFVFCQVKNNGIDFEAIDDKGKIIDHDQIKLDGINIKR
jgi:predicted phosphodiesterase